MAYQLDDRNRDLGDDDDQAPGSDEITPGNPYHLSRGTRLFLRIVAVMLVLSMTALFLRGFINR